MNLKEMFDKSRELWGLSSQILMLVEELNELSVASLHLLRNLKPKEESLEHFAEEIADVEFLLDEMKYYFQNVPLIVKYRKLKEQKLKGLLEVSNQK